MSNRTSHRTIFERNWDRLHMVGKLDSRTQKDYIKEACRAVCIEALRDIEKLYQEGIKKVR